MRSIQQHQISKADKLFRTRLAATPILDHPSFKYSFDICGYKNHTYGAVTGPVIEISNLFHEMAHSIEFILAGYTPNNRCINGEFRFHINQIYQYGELYPNPTTTQCIDRECRTFAIQLKMLESFGFKVDVMEFCQYSSGLSIWLPDWPLIEGKNDMEKRAICFYKIFDFYKKLNITELIDAQISWLDKIDVKKNPTS